MVFKKRMVIVAFFFLLSACNQDQHTKNSKLALMKTTNPSPVMTNKNKSADKIEDIKKDVSSFPEIYDVAVVKGKKDTLVVYKVKHLQRFRMQKIEKDLNKMLQKRYPKENITVSSDYKIFLEAVRLNEKIKTDKNFSAKEAEKRLGEIVKMTEEMT